MMKKVFSVILVICMLLCAAGGGTIRATAVGFRKVRLEDGDFPVIHRLLEQTLSDGAVLTVIRAGASEWLRLTWDKDGVHYALTNTDGAGRDALLAVYETVK